MFSTGSPANVLASAASSQALCSESVIKSTVKVCVCAYARDKGAKRRPHALVSRPRRLGSNRAVSLIAERAKSFMSLARESRCPIPA